MVSKYRINVDIIARASAVVRSAVVHLSRGGEVARNYRMTIEKFERSAFGDQQSVRTRSDIGNLVVFSISDDRTRRRAHLARVQRE